MNIQNLRSLAIDASEKSSFDTAIFFADKLVALDPDNLDNVYLLAQCYFKSGQYKRANHLLQKYRQSSLSNFKSYNDASVNYNIHSDIYKKCTLLLAKCRVQCKDWYGCIEVLGDHKQDEEEMRREDSDEQVPIGEGIKTDAAICLLRGDAFEALDLRQRAVYWYKKALYEDVFCYEAWAKLTDKLMLTGPEEQQVIRSLQFPKNAEWLRTFYLCKTSSFMSCFGSVKNGVVCPGKNYEQIEPFYKLEQSRQFEDNEYVLAFKANSAFYYGEFSNAYKISKKILDKYPHSTSVLPVHIACLVELDMTNDLYYLAHNLIDQYPKAAISWYAVGCYYYLIGSWPSARRYFSKSNVLDPEFGLSWLSYGHTFAREGEHDQAMASYRTASRLLAGSHIPYLSIASELIRVNNLELASEFVGKACQMQPLDPCSVHEVGVIQYLKGNWKKAIEHFEKVLEMVENNLTETFEPTLFNAAHAYRKIKNYDKAIEYYEQAANLLPYNPTVYAALGYTYHLRGNLDDAIHYYHQALGLLPEHSFSADMLQQALEEQFTQTDASHLLAL